MYSDKLSLLGLQQGREEAEHEKQLVTEKGPKVQ